MTEPDVEDVMALDTNVFLHLLYDPINTDKHIHSLLLALQRRKIRLLVDDGDRIGGEYKDKIGPRIKEVYDTGTEIQLLRYWMNPELRTSVPVNFASQLMNEIKKVIVEKEEGVDRVFVHVALSQGRRLVSNDWKNIVLGPPTDRSSHTRRHRILQNTKKLRPDGGDILTSKEASSEIA